MSNLYGYNNSLANQFNNNNDLNRFVATNPMNFGSWNNSYNNAFTSAKNTLNNNNSGIIWVNGIEGAKGYIIQPNSSTILMDSEQNCFYLKTTNDAGIPSIRIFEFQEKIQKQNKNNIDINIDEKLKDYVPRKEFEEIKNILANITEKLTTTINNNSNNSLQTETKNNNISTNKYIEKKEVK